MTPCWSLPLHCNIAVHRFPNKEHASSNAGEERQWRLVSAVARANNTSLEELHWRWQNSDLSKQHC
jgi:hypothetical protein